MRLKLLASFPGTHMNQYFCLCPSDIFHLLPWNVRRLTVRWGLDEVFSSVDARFPGVLPGCEVDQSAVSSHRATICRALSLSLSLSLSLQPESNGKRHMKRTAQGCLRVSWPIKNDNLFVGGEVYQVPSITCPSNERVVKVDLHRRLVIYFSKKYGGE